MKKKKHDAIVWEPKQLLNLSPKVTNCCKSLRLKYSFQKVKHSFQKAYMSQLVSSQPVSAMSRNPDHNPPSQPMENSIEQNHHQEEIIHKLARQLRNIGDSIDHRMVQEDFQQEGRAILAHFVLVFFGGIHMFLRFLYYNHVM
ncbi:peroxisomal testis-specific protein 1 [Kogia breviceps]|uniref:peroxisomal testis-specific protein 1 n=1 Tax=Kogia breviceps TaxID=27615 RepID=UPI0027952845|nr:peroxisomal testis-specific protein 1 [Kogia breviceps]